MTATTVSKSTVYLDLSFDEQSFVITEYRVTANPIRRWAERTHPQHLYGVRGTKLQRSRTDWIVTFTGQGRPYGQLRQLEPWKSRTYGNTLHERLVH
jgi:hypothetical protein